MAKLRNPSSNNESGNANSATHDAIAQDKYDADNMDFSSDKEYTVTASNISSSEDSGTQNQIPSEFDQGVNELVALTKELNLQAVKRTQRIPLCLKTR